MASGLPGMKVLQFAFDGREGMVREGMSSVAVLFFAQLQDYLELDSTSRVNTPGTMDGNWEWRVQTEQLTRELACRIADMTRLYGRRNG